jgi:hypothetical protein
MNPENMIKGHYYWKNGELFICTHWISKEENGYGNAKLKRIYPKFQVSGSWYCFKHWRNRDFIRHNP